MIIELRDEIFAALLEHDLIESDDELDLREIPAGVSSQIWLAASRHQSFVIKRPLSVLRVEIEWRAPLERGYFEFLWLVEAGRLLGDLVPKVFAYDEQRRLLIMSYFDRQQYRTLKELYFAHDVRAELAVGVGAALAKVHSAFAGDQTLKAKFDARESLYATRIDPYFVATAARNPEFSHIIHQLANQMLASDTTVIHGDVSPKNILVGPISPVFLDAECACIGDPSFDVAFFLTHLCLKCLIRPERTDSFIESAVMFFRTYLENADPQLGDIVEKNTGSYLALFLLARVDGKSPVEYLRNDAEIGFVRDFSRGLMSGGTLAIPDIVERWAAAVRSRAN